VLEMDLIGKIKCALRKHDLKIAKELSMQADLVKCSRCGKLFAYKHSGDWAGAVLPFDREFEEFYKTLPTTTEGEADEQ
jgi:hypothetical protein